MKNICIALGVLVIGFIVIVLTEGPTLFQDFRGDPQSVTGQVVVGQDKDRVPEDKDACYDSLKYDTGGQQVVKECLYDKVSTLEKEMNQRYAVTQADNFDEDMSGPIKDSQEKWLVYVQSQCTAYSSSEKGGTLESLEFADCKIGLLEKRIVELKIFNENK